MRVKDKLVRSGFFWLPGKEDYKAPGTLTISEAGKVHLEILGSFSGPTGSAEDLRNETMTIGRVVGQIEKEGMITLERCFYRKLPYGFGGVVKSEVGASWAILGVAFDADEEIVFDEQYASIQGFEEWLRVSGLSLSLIDPPRIYSVEYRRPEPITMYESNDFTVSVGFGHTIPSITDVKHAEVIASAYLKISAREPQKPGFFTNIVTMLREFLSFAVDTTVSVTEVWAINKAITEPIGEGKTKPAKMDLYYRSKNHLDVAPKIDSFRMLFRYLDLQGNSQKIFASWFELYDVILPVLHLYFSTRAGSHKFLEGRFLSLAQAIETLHRRTSTETAMAASDFANLKDLLIKAAPDAHKELVGQKLSFANEISLANRLKRILEPFEDRFGNDKDRKRLVRMIVDTRNYLTHYDPKSEHKSADGMPLYVLCEKMEALLQLHFLKTLSFSDDQVEAVCVGPQALKDKLNLRFDSAS
ncbi:HEPN domain-containing protein [Agrobacterium tumefaciens]|uniref:ApeA N-terminal domain 1-containing protein n=1 Tax=Agrobacterium tumefaciens TaxID=358 RepID=UPI000471337B